MERDRHLGRMREIVTGDDSIHPLADDDRSLAEAIVFLIEKRTEDLARERAQNDEFSKLKSRVEELERRLESRE